MNQLCLNQTPCPSDLPLGNFSSETPDKVDYVTLIGPPPQFLPPIGGNTWKTRYCLGVCVSHESQQDADLCAAQNAIKCLVHTEGDGGGGGGGGGGGYSRPDPNNPVPPVPPGYPTPPNPALKIYESHSADCTVYCPDGTPHSETLGEGSFNGINQAIADARARSAACSQARINMICFGTIEKRACLAKDFSTSIKVSGGSPPYALTIDGTTGALPPGLKIKQLDPLTAEISGKPLAAGPFQFDIVATSAVTGATASHVFEIDVLGLADDTDLDMPDGEYLQFYSWQFEADGGTSPYKFTASSGLSFWGMTLDEDGYFHGTPSEVGELTFFVTVEDAIGNKCSEEVSFTFFAPPLTEKACAEEQFDLLFGGFTGQTLPLSWEIVEGTLPQGMNLEVLSAEQCAITGQPYPGGTYEFRMKTTGANKVVVQQRVTLNVLDIINRDTLPQAIVNLPYSAQLEGIGGEGKDPTYTFARIGGNNWPAGLSMNGTGLISGTPTVQGTTTGILVRVTDNSNNECHIFLDITIYPPPPVDFSAMNWVITQSFMDLVCPGWLAAIGQGAAVQVEASTTGPNPGDGPCNAFIQHYITYVGTLTTAANANSICRLNVLMQFNNAIGASGLAWLYLRNSGGGMMYSLTTSHADPQAFDFLWGDTGGSITIEIHCAASNAHFGGTPPPGVPFSGDALVSISLYSHL